MNRDEMQDALSELGARLEADGVRAKLWLVGGAAMVLAFQSRQSSDDLDAAYYAPDVVLDVARNIGIRRGFGSEWLNDAAKAYVPIAVEPDWQILGSYGALEVFRADEHTLLAMKLRASRGARDFADIEYLIDRCGFTSVQEVVNLYETFFPEDPLPQRARPLIRKALSSAEGDAAN